MSRRLFRAFATVGGWTLASRVLGFARDLATATLLGAGPVAEAFMIAFALPNMFRRFFAEGAFNMAFVPLYTKKRAEDPGKADQFASDAFTLLGAVLIGFTLLAQLAMPALVWAMASGFAADERFDLATDFGRIVFPYILLISLAALLSGALNATGRFAAAAAAPVLLNIILIGAIALAAWVGWDVGLAMSIAVPVAGVAQLALLWRAARRAGITLRLKRPRLTPELRRLLVIAAPAALAGGVVQVNLLVGRQVASQYDGAVAWLSYADRLYQLPLGLIGVAVGVVLLPELSRRIAQDDARGGQESFSRATEIALLLTLPAAAALVAMPEALVQVLFERGAFTPEDTAATAAAVAIYGLGLPAFVLQKTVMPLFFAREDTRTPFRFALVAMLVNAAIAVGMAWWLGYLAAALATTLSSWVLYGLLWRAARKLGQAAAWDAQLRRAVPRHVLAALIMGLALWGLSIFAAPALALGWIRILALGALIIAGGAVYFTLLQLLGCFDAGMIRAAFRRPQGET